MSKSLEALCLQLAHYCAITRDIPFKANKTLWKMKAMDIQVDIQTLLRYAHRHKVLDTVLTAIQSDDSPDCFKRRVLLERGAKSLMLVQWQSIHRKLDQLKIPNLIFKGPASSIQLYGNPYTREYTDLDILVRIERWKEIVEGLEELGWVTKDIGFPMETTPIASTSHHVVFMNTHCPFRLEVHRNLDTTGNYTKDRLEQIFTHMKVFNWNGIELPTLSTIDHFELILDHGTKHSWTLMHWLLDGAKMLQSCDETFLRRIELRHSMLQLGIMIRLVESLFPIELPKSYHTLHHNPSAQLDLLCRYCKTHLIGGGGTSSSIIHILFNTFYYKMSFANSLQDKLAVGFSLWRIPQQDIDRLALPRCLFWLHYPLRPFFVLERRIRRKINKDIA